MGRASSEGRAEEQTAGKVDMSGMTLEAAAAAAAEAAGMCAAAGGDGGLHGSC